MKRFATVLLTALVLLPCLADDVSTTSPGYWTNAAIWTPHAPTSGDDVSVDHAVTLDASPPALNSLTNSATLTFSGWGTVLTADTVHVRATITHPENSATTTNASGEWPRDHRVYIVATNLTIDSGASIDTYRKGWQGVANNPPYGYGEGAAVGDRDGAGHGGLGGVIGSGGGPTYGSTTQPEAPGSGGDGSYGPTGGDGGGAVRIIVTDTLTVNGTVNANGQSSGSNFGGGSGGSIWINCRILQGTGGSVTANGGTVTQVGGGGGGRIAVYCDPASQQAAPAHSVNFSVRRGEAPGSNDGGHGTLYLNDQSLLTDTMNGFNSGVLHGINPTTWDADTLSMVNSWLIFRTNLVMTVTNDLTMNGSIISFDRPWPGQFPLHLDVGGDLLLTNGSALYVYSGPTNGATPTYGGRVGVTGTLTVAGSTIHPYSDPTNGGSVLFQVGALELAGDGGIDADKKGFSGGRSGHNDGYGYGPGLQTGSAPARGGGGYGGLGGGNAANRGQTYGDYTAPLHPGSGGAWRTGEPVGLGGGLVRIAAAGTVNLHGTITADGYPLPGGATDWACGGSGGGIYITCDTLGVAAGLLSADGGSGWGGYGGLGGGGGGRVALISVADNFAGTITVDALTGGQTSYGNETGTIYRARPPGLLNLVVAGDPAVHGTSSPYNYGASGVYLGSVLTNRVNDQADEANGLRFGCIGWSVSNELGATSSGTTTQAVYTVTSNAWQTWYWTNVWELITTAGSNGSLVADKGGWYTNLTTVQVQATADGGYSFLQWIGDVPYEDRFDNPITLTMDQRRTVAAAFADGFAEVKVWSGNGSWYENLANWTGADLPGTNDAVEISSGSTCLLKDPADMAGLSVYGTLNITSVTGVINTDTNVAHTVVDSDVVVSGSTARIEVRGASLTTAGALDLLDGADLYTYCNAQDIPGSNYCALVDVHGALSLSSNSWVYPWSDALAGGSAFFNVGSVRIPTANAGFDANGRGYKGGANTWGAGPGRGGAQRSSAGFGGVAAGNLPGGTYGSSNAPVQPGSSGGGDYGGTGGSGGGSVRIDARGGITVNGILAANGGSAGPNAGSGSGGSINIHTYGLGGTGTVTANGGDHSSSGYYGAGGGGRIAIEVKYLGISTNDITANAGTDANAVPVAGDGTVVLTFIPIKGTLLMVR